MRCSYCGLPLSPAKKSGTCPRCSAPIGSKPPSNALQAPAWSPAQENQNYAWGMVSGQSQQQEEVPYTGLSERSVGAGGVGDTPSPAPLFQSLEQPQNQVWSPAHISVQTPVQMHSPSLVQDSTPRLHTPAPSSTPTPAWIGSLNGQAQVESYTNTAARSKHGGQLGFTIAGLCIITGALLLIFVYVISIDLPQNAATSALTPAQPIGTAHAKPTAVVSPTASPSTTVAFPGQQYISNAQMASSIDKSTAQPEQTATTFPIGNPVYVTFLVHPNGQSGEVCLSWYLNGKFTSNYSFPIGAANTTAYSYTYYHTSGQADVELSWSNSANCANALLAQRVNFTIQI